MTGAAPPDRTGEERLLARILGSSPPLPRREVPVGPGDDAAAVRLPDGDLLLLTTDAAEEGVHFDRRLHPDWVIGRRAVVAALSDIAAMGGTPLATLLSLVAPPEDEEFAAAVSRFAAEGALNFGAPLVGGNITSGQRLALHVTVAGVCEEGTKPLRRSGARPGDTLFVTGELGGAALWLELLRKPGPVLLDELAVSQLNPRPPLPAGAAAAGVATAAMDLSDGLALDLHRLAEASGVGALVEADRLPLARPGPAGLEAALFGGEDYELLLTGPERAVCDAVSRVADPPVAIGRITPPDEGVRLLRPDGRTEPLPRRGWDSWSLTPPRTPPPPK